MVVDHQALCLQRRSMHPGYMYACLEQRCSALIQYQELLPRREVKAGSRAVKSQAETLTNSNLRQPLVLGPTVATCQTHKLIQSRPTGSLSRTSFLPRPCDNLKSDNSPRLALRATPTRTDRHNHVLPQKLGTAAHLPVRDVL